VASSLESPVERVGHEKGPGFQLGANVLWWGRGGGFDGVTSDAIWGSLCEPCYTLCIRTNRCRCGVNNGRGAQQWRGADPPRAFVTLPRMRNTKFPSTMY
jgi:hypothetical protein